MPERLAGREPADLRRPRPGRERGVEHVDVERQEERPLPDPRPHAPGVLLGAQGHELLERNHLEAELGGHLLVLEVVERASHAGEQRSAGVEETLLDGSTERRAVVVALAAVRVPHVGMSVEEHEAERAVHRGVRAKLSKHHDVIAAKAQRSRTRANDRLKALRDLAHGPLRVPRRHRDVPEIGDREPPEDLRLLDRVVRTERDRRGADRLRPEARARAVGRRRVEGDAEGGDVDALGVVDQRAAREGPWSRVAGRRERIGRPVAGSLKRHAATVPAHPVAVRSELPGKRTTRREEGPVAVRHEAFSITVSPSIRRLRAARRAPARVPAPRPRAACAG